MNPRSLFTAIAIISSLQLPVLAHAERLPKAVKQDARIRTVPFEQDNVVYLTTMLRVATMVQLNDDEEITDKAMGDSFSWMVVEDQHNRNLFIKPLVPNKATNLTIITTKRTYNFMLSGLPEGNSRNAIIKLRFIYPDDEADARLMDQAKAKASMPNVRAAMSDPSKLNYNYGFKGNPESKPVTVADDGTKTFFKFSGDIPAIFAVKADRSETLVNYRREGDYIVVDKVAKQWTLRNGSVATCIFNLNRTGNHTHYRPSGNMTHDR